MAMSIQQIAYSMKWAYGRGLPVLTSCADASRAHADRASAFKQRCTPLYLCWPVRWILWTTDVARSLMLRAKYESIHHLGCHLLTPAKFMSLKDDFHQKPCTTR